MCHFIIKHYQHRIYQIRLLLILLMRMINQLRSLNRITFKRKSLTQFNAFGIHNLHVSTVHRNKLLQNQQLSYFSTKPKISEQQTFKLIIQRLKRLSERFEQIQKILISIALEQKNINSEDLRKQMNKLQPIVNIYEKVTAAISNIKDLKQMEAQVKEQSQKELIRQEIQQLNKKLEVLREESLQALIQPDLYDDCSEINCEFRSGAGGTESAIFVEDISNMYINYCRSQGWKVSVVSGVRQNVLHKGYKSLILKIIGQESYKIMKCQAGVHKVIRVPQTQAKGRLHSSTISVAIMPNVPFDFVVNEKDIKYEFMKSSGPGGQSVNKTQSACRATHVPTGISVSMQDDRSQDRNKKKATQILKQRVFEIEWKKNIQSEARARKSQIGTMDRSEKIRTYNFPQDRITDHRTGLTLFGMEQMMNGTFLQQFIHAYQNKIYEQKLQVLLQELNTSAN